MRVRKLNGAGGTGSYTILIDQYADNDGYSATSDCNDNDAAINPGAVELCDGVDNDCDTQIDEGCATYYQDADSDTYGNAAVSQVATSQPEGYVLDNTDCNDSIAAIHPGATDICNDEIDQDCNGSDMLCFEKGLHETFNPESHNGARAFRLFFCAKDTVILLVSISFNLFRYLV